MTKEDIIRMAREARIEQDGDMFYSFRNSDKDQDVHIDDLVRFADLVAAAAVEREREACARVCENMSICDEASYYAASIRARNNT